MNAIGGPYAEAWREIGRSLPRPRAVLMVSAHWYVEGIGVTSMERPRTIHDFHGFPPQLYDVRYPAPSAPWLARRLSELIGAREDQEWGLDHGAWSVLVHVFPQADIPVVQLSLDIARPAAEHLALAQKLRTLRDEGVLIAGSGNIVHNLRLVRWGEKTPAFEWAERFDARVRDLIIAGNHALLADYENLGEDARLSVPTPEHYLPLLYVLAQRDAGEPVSFFNVAIDLASISMTGVRIG